MDHEYREPVWMMLTRIWEYDPAALGSLRYPRIWNRVSGRRRDYSVEGSIIRCALLAVSMNDSHLTESSFGKRRSSPTRDLVIDLDTGYERPCSGHYGGIPARASAYFENVLTWLEVKRVKHRIHDPRS